ncbi:hypothetical protein PP744_gp092 [Rhizobium phage RHph_N38]|uniref:Uncharacterized protein n=1 Tax=Rhizobium phage RHph_N38 TaxID=2509750 RepID=A0A7S5UUQ7_9CAUD|nr:hypothetical protein PP744_gp092 [Rhizobium phage RHph_N38]QIG70563.1 hypothetical protein EVB89_102 [Rhizobium phage RHph_N38]
MYINEAQLERLINGLQRYVTTGGSGYLISTDVIDNLVNALLYYQNINRRLETELTRLILDKENH